MSLTWCKGTNNSLTLFSKLQSYISYIITTNYITMLWSKCPKRLVCYSLHLILVDNPRQHRQHFKYKICSSKSSVSCGVIWWGNLKEKIIQHKSLIFEYTYSIRHSGIHVTYDTCIIMNIAAQNLGFQSIGWLKEWFLFPLDVRLDHQKVTMAIEFASTHPSIHLAVSCPGTL